MAVRPGTKDGTVQIIRELDTYTVAGLIAELQQHILIDPARANHPVTIVPGGSGNTRYLPAVAAATGNDDPEIGGHHQVMLICVPSPRTW